MSQYSNEPAQSSTAGTYGPGTGYQPPTKPRRPRRRITIIAVLIAILLIILVLLFFPRPAASVTLTPVSKTLSGSVMGSYGPRELSSPQQDTGSGVPIKPGTHATGMLTFKNYTPNWVKIPKGTAITNVTSERVVTDEDVLVPPDPIIPGIASGMAHAVKVGKSGNIRAMSINKSCCLAGIFVLNESDFSGGVDDQVGNTVQQSDIDQIAKPLVASITQKASSDLHSQLKSGEQFAKAPLCSRPTVTPNPGVGVSATKFTVNVSLTCSASAYNPLTVPLSTENMLKQKAIQQLNPGPGFVLVGNIAIKVEQETLRKDGMIDVKAKASGTWKFKFTADQKLNMAKLIARKTIAEAKALLLQQPGVAGASISVSGPVIDLGGHNIVPDDLRAITING